MFTPRSFGKVGVEAYAAYALRAWLASEHAISDRTRRFAKWSAICSLLLGMAGQVTYHLLAQAGAAKAPWAITTIVSCLPVLVLAMGTTLAHMLQVDRVAADTPDRRTRRPPAVLSADRDHEDQDQPHQNTGGDAGMPTDSGLPADTETPEHRIQTVESRTREPDNRVTESKSGQWRLVASRLAATGRPVSRRTLRSHGLRGSNEALNALARKINAEMETEHTTP
jgi:hypothetical protein